MHQLSVTSDKDSVLNCLEYSERIKKHVCGETVTFSADTGSEIDGFKNDLARAIAAVIENDYRPEIITRLIETDHSYLAPCDKKLIFNKLQKESVRCPETVFSELLSYLSESDTISVEGFVRFRLPEYKKELRRELDIAVRKFLAEREYYEFIDLLAYFVSCREPKEEHIHICVTPNGGFGVYDSAFCDITTQCAVLVADSFSGDEISYDDILLGALIITAPRKITFHNAPLIRTPELLDTITGIFKDRVFFCPGCHLCN